MNRAISIYAHPWLRAGGSGSGAGGTLGLSVDFSRISVLRHDLKSPRTEHVLRSGMSRAIQHTLGKTRVLGPSACDATCSVCAGVSSVPFLDNPTSVLSQPCFLIVPIINI